MKQKWLINIYKEDKLFSQYKTIGYFKTAKVFAEKTAAKIPGSRYTITEIM